MLEIEAENDLNQSPVVLIFKTSFASVYLTIYMLSPQDNLNKASCGEKESFYVDLTLKPLVG